MCLPKDHCLANAGTVPGNVLLSYVLFPCPKVREHSPNLEDGDGRVLTIKRKKCIRLTTGIKPPQRGTIKHEGINHTERYYKWYESMVGKSCKGKICPHLGTTMQVVGDKLICPLHNLRGSLREEVILNVK